MKKILFSICILLIAACSNNDDEIVQNETPADIQALLNNGIIIDSITSDYASIYQSNDNFPVIKPNPVDRFINDNEILIYFDLKSSSRESLLKYYAKKDAENLKEGFIEDYGLKYYDKLKNISVEVKKNNDEFYKIENNSNIVKMIPTPEINSQYSFAKYELTIEEFIQRYKISFPDYFVFSFNNKEVKLNTYTFRTTFKFNNNKQFVLITDQITF